jgi:hypothetical protein
MNPMAALAVEALGRGLTIELTARGGSMRPLLYDGDRLSVEPARAAALRLDDVAVALQEGGLVIHRVVSLAPLILRGDALGADDTARVEVIGRVLAFRRRGLKIRLDARAGRLWSKLCRLASRVCQGRSPPR